MRAALLLESECHRCTRAFLLRRCVRHNLFDRARPGLEGGTGVGRTSSRWRDSYLSSRQSRRKPPEVYASSNAPGGWARDPGAGVSNRGLTPARNAVAIHRVSPPATGPHVCCHSRPGDAEQIVSRKQVGEDCQGHARPAGVRLAGLVVVGDGFAMPETDD
jgi:hypothetical protein